MNNLCQVKIKVLGSFQDRGGLLNPTLCDKYLWKYVVLIKVKDVIWRASTINHVPRNTKNFFHSYELWLMPYQLLKMESSLLARTRIWLFSQKNLLEGAMMTWIITFSVVSKVRNNLSLLVKRNLPICPTFVQLGLGLSWPLKWASTTTLHPTPAKIWHRHSLDQPD